MKFQDWVILDVASIANAETSRTMML